MEVILPSWRLEIMPYALTDYGMREAVRRAKLPHNRTRRPVRRGWAAFVKLSLCHREELPIELSDLGFSSGIGV